MKRLNQTEEIDNPTLPDEIIVEITNYLPFHDIRIFHSWLMVSRRGFFYVKTSLYELLMSYIFSSTQTYQASSLFFDLKMWMSTLPQNEREDKRMMLFQYATRCLFDVAWQEADYFRPFLSLLYLTHSFGQFYLFGEGRIYAIHTGYLDPGLSCSCIYYYDESEKIAYSLTKMEDVTALKLCLTKEYGLRQKNNKIRESFHDAAHMYRTLSDNLPLRQVRPADLLSDLVYNGELLVSDKNVPFLKSCFRFTGPGEWATGAYQTHKRLIDLSLFKQIDQTEFKHRVHDDYILKVLSHLRELKDTIYDIHQLT